MAKKPYRGIEMGYFMKTKRLADSMEQDKPFRIQNDAGRITILAEANHNTVA
jgi:hypothetical protein